jgi:transcription elongation factor Elf1
LYRNIEDRGQRTEDRGQRTEDRRQKTEVSITRKRDDMKCLKCAGKLEVKRMCTRTYLYCKECGAKYKLEELKDSIDDELEEFLAMVHCDRL